jgi:hypothetical protein
MAAFSDFICAAIYSKGATHGKVIISCGRKAQEKYRDTGHIGVIGVAIFNERGTSPWTDREVKERLQANPFPSRFATPP